MPTLASFAAPSAEEYVGAFRAISPLSYAAEALLQAHYHAPACTATSRQLAAALGYSRYSVVNAQYGRLARRVGERLGYNPEPERLGTLVLFEHRGGEWHWTLRPEVARAVELLGWASPANAMRGGRSDEVPDLDLEYGASREGRKVWVAHLRRERDPALARHKKDLVRRQGTLACEVCGLIFDQLPGSLGEACCEVHHARPLGEEVAEVETSLNDLHVLCANCHRMIHRTRPLKSITEMRALYRGE